MLLLLWHTHQFLCGFLLDILQYAHVLLALGRPKPGTADQMYLTSAEQRRRIMSLDLLETPFLMQAEMLVAFFAARAHYWFMISLSIRTPRSFSAELLASRVAPGFCWCMSLFLPVFRTSYFLLLNFLRLFFPCVGLGIPLCQTS